MAEFKSMVFYVSWYEIADQHGEKFRNKVINQLLRYGLYGEVPENKTDPLAKMMFEMAKPSIDANIKKKVYGAKGGRPGAPKGNQNAKKKQITIGLSNVDADANEDADADADANVNEDGASASASLGASRSEPIEKVDVSKLKGRSKK